MFARFVCDLLGFCARKFPAKSKSQEPGKIIVERTLYTSLDPYGVTSYGISEEFRSPCVIFKNSVWTCEIIYTKDMVVYMHKTVYTH